MCCCTPVWRATNAAFVANGCVSPCPGDDSKTCGGPVQANGDVPHDVYLVPESKR